MTPEANRRASTSIREPQLSGHRARGLPDDRGNTQVAVEVTPLLARMKGPDYVRLPIPPEWTLGSFSVAGFVNLAEDPGRPEVILRYRATHQVPDGGPTILVAQTIVDGPAEICLSPPRPMRIATFPSLAVVTDAATGRFTLDSSAR